MKRLEYLNNRNQIGNLETEVPRISDTRNMWAIADRTKEKHGA